MSESVLSLIVGLIVLFSIIGLRQALERRRYVRLRKLWEEGERAVNERRLADAERALQAAVDMEGLWLPARQLLAQVHALQGKLDRAEQELQMASALRPRDGMGHFALALFYARFLPSRQEDALAALEQAIALDPKMRDLARQRGEDFGEVGNTSRFQSLIGNE